MPLDRPATLRLMTAGSRNEFGEYLEGAVTEYRVWLTRVDAPVDRDVTLEGTRVVTPGRFRLRWLQELADFDVRLTGELLFDGRNWIITGVDEVDAADVRTDQQRSLRSRRRWLAVTANETTRA